MNNPKVITKFMQYAVVAMALNASGCKARDVPPDWKVDCVGRQQLSFPNEVEVAANSAKMLEDEYKIQSPQPRFEFQNGEYAGWSIIQIPEWVLISYPLSEVERDRLEMSAKQQAERTRESIKTKNKFTRNSKSDFEFVSITPRRGIASHVNGAYDASFFVGENMVRTWSGGDKVWEQQRQEIYTFLAKINPRPTGRIPLTSGLCIPYAFIQDDGNRPRFIGTTYRLREHPDVTVLLKDGTAVEIDPKANQAVYDPESISNFFWSQYDSSYRKSLRSVWNTPYKKATLANSKGVESFVKIVRNDDAVDYGYLVATRGDPDAKEDTPDLMLYVIQDSKNAKAKGIAPMEKDAFLEMAQTIAASVKRRPVTGQ